MKRTTLVLVAAAALLCASLSWGADTATLRAIGQGKAVYLTQCAPCHGADSTGGGAGSDGHPFAVPDLTRIEEREGTFDPIHVAVHIEGRPSGKCTADMPCWSQRLAQAYAQDRARAFLEVYKLVKYLEFVQGGMPTVESVQASARR